MTDTTKDIDAELKETQLAAAKLDLKIKELDLNSRPGILKSSLTNPVALAAIIAALVTLSSGIISYVVSVHQIALESEKSQAQSKLETKKFESQLIMEAVKAGSPDQAAVNLQFLVDAGLVMDRAPELRGYLRSRVPGAGKFLAPGNGNRN